MLNRIKKFLGIGQPATVQADSGITTPVQIVVGPQYWIETHYTCVERMPQLAVVIAKKALEHGFIKDVANEITQAALVSLRETFIGELKSNVPPNEAIWKVWSEDNTLKAEIRAVQPQHWKKVTSMWPTIKTRLAKDGIQTATTEYLEDAQKLTAHIKFPIGQIKLDLDSPVCWEVLNKNKGNVILWNSKIWTPKKAID